MNFINDIDLIARGGGRVTHTIQQLAHILYACPRSRVHLQNIHMGRAHNQVAMLTLGPKLHARAINSIAFIIEGSSQKTGCGCLTNPPNAREHKGMSHSSSFKGILESRDHRLLADHILKGCRAVFAGQDLIMLIGAFAHPSLIGVSNQIRKAFDKSIVDRVGWKVLFIFLQELNEVED